MRYSTGCVSIYSGCGADDLPWAVWNGRDFQAWYEGASLGNQNFMLFSGWENGDVWASDFRDSGGDLAADGGSDVPDVYFFSGHGICQDAPTATDPDFISVCGNNGLPNDVDIGAECLWGSGSGGNLKFLFLDASCPMDFEARAQNWYSSFLGLHVATGNSGTSSADTIDSPWRAAQFAGYTVGSFSQFFKDPFGGFGSTVFGGTFGLGGSWYPLLSVGDAWMITGIIDVQPGCCAMVIAAGETKDDAHDRKHNETVWDGRPDPTPNWFGWRKICSS